MNTKTDVYSSAFPAFFCGYFHFWLRVSRDGFIRVHPW